MRCTKEENNHGRENLATRRWWRPINGERRSSWREHHGNVAVLKNVCGSTMCKYECEYGCENVDKKSDPGEEKDRSISSSRGQFFKSGSRARLCGNGQREKAKWQAYRGSVDALSRNSHEDTGAEMSRCGNGVTAARVRSAVRT